MSPAGTEVERVTMRRAIPIVASIAIAVAQAASIAAADAGSDSERITYRWALVPAETIKVHTGFGSRPSIQESSLQLSFIVRNREDEAAAVHSIILVTERNELFHVPGIEGWPVILPGENFERQVSWEFDRPTAEVLGRTGSVIVEVRVGVAAEKVYFNYGRHEQP